MTPVSPFRLAAPGLALGLLVSPPPSPAQSYPAGRSAGWPADLDTLVGQIRAQHWVYRSQPVPGVEMMTRRLRDSLSGWSDERVLVELERFMAGLGDGHSYCLPWGANTPAAALPIHLYWFPEGLYVVGAEPGHERWIGSRVSRFDRVPAGEAYRRLDPYISRDNEYGIRWIGPFFLRLRGVLEAVSDAVGPAGTAMGARLTLEPPGGRAEEVVLPLVPLGRVRGIPKLGPSRLPGAPPPPLYLQEVDRPVRLVELDNGATLYVGFNQVVDAPDESLAAFAGRLSAAAAQPVRRRVIVDVRHNNGGHAELADPLVAVFRELRRQRPGLPVFVLTGRNTFSAAQIFITRMDREAAPIFAGEPSSSKPNFVGEENVIRLPWSGALCSISNRHHEPAPGDRRAWIAPRIAMELRAADYFANRDPLLEAVRRFTP